METHPNFKSVVKINADKLSYVNDLLEKQEDDGFEKMATEEELLQSFKIKLENVDRLYYFHVDVDNSVIEIVARQDYPFSYVEFTYDLIKGGKIYITQDAKLFIKNLKWLFTKEEKLKIYNLFEEDGISITWEDADKENETYKIELRKYKEFIK